MNPAQSRPLAVVTGASSGIGFELARIAAQDGHDLLIVADRPEIAAAAETLRAHGGQVEALQLDLATVSGVDELHAAIKGRTVEALFANAGHGLGGAFLDQSFGELRHIVDTNITGTIYLIQKVGREMRARGEGRILITGSIAGYLPGSFQAVYNGTKAFIDSFAWALRNELKDSGVTVTVLMPGATDTEFFKRARMQDTKVGSGKKDDPAYVAQVGYDAMMKGQADVVSGLRNKLQTIVASVAPATMTAQMHRRMAEPGTGSNSNGMSKAGKQALALAGVALAAAGAATIVRGRRARSQPSPVRTRSDGDGQWTAAYAASRPVTGSRPTA